MTTESLTPRTDAVIATENNYGEYIGGDGDGVTPQEAHEGMVSSLTRLSRDLERALAAEVERLKGALSKIHDFTTGYDDVAGIVNKIAREALSEQPKEGRENELGQSIAGA